VRPGQASQPLAPWVTRFEFNPTTKQACITFAINSPDTVFYQVQCSAVVGFITRCTCTSADLPAYHATPVRMDGSAWGREGLCKGFVGKQTQLV
jgi:hypothetical protein